MTTLEINTRLTAVEVRLDALTILMHAVHADLRRLVETDPIDVEERRALVRQLESNESWRD